MTLEELERELKSNEERLVSSLDEYKKAKAELRKARITSISNKLLAPYRRFKIEKAIAKYDAMMEKIEKKREKEIRKAEKLQEKEQKLERKQAKEDFKAAIRDKRKEDIINFVNDKKDDVINLGSEVSNTFLHIKEMGASKVSRASSFAINVKNSAIKKVRENTTIDLTIKNAIESVKLKYETNKYNKIVEMAKKEEEKVKEQELNNAINFDEGVKIELKNRDIPFSNINEKMQKAKRQSCYLGKATNRVVKYFKSKKDNLTDNFNDKVNTFKFNVALNTYEVIGKVSRTKSRIVTKFNTELKEIKDIGVDRYNSIKRDIKNNIDSISSAHQEYKDKTLEKRKEKEQDIAIKRVQLDSMREALESINSTENAFSKPPSLNTSRVIR